MRALVLSGGGSHGAYEVGVLKHLVGDLGIKYDLISGVSVGALNGSFLAMYPAGMETSAYKGLENLWLGLNTSSIYKDWWPFGKLSLLWKPSLYDSSPLEKIVRNGLDGDKVRASGKMLRIGATGLSSGVYRSFNENFYDLPGAVLASAIDPGFLTPINIQGQLFVDGGLMHITPLGEAINAGATEIDIIQSSPVYDSVNFPLKSSLVALALRAIDLMCDGIQTSDLKLCDAYNELVTHGNATDKRLVHYTLYRPEPGLVPDSLDFSPASIRAMIDRGYKDAVLRRG